MAHHMDDWKEIDFEVDLVKAAKLQLEFLQNINDLKDLYDGVLLKRAIFRYETHWLPLLCQHGCDAIVAPVDVTWVWHCHMLSPTSYLKDCLKLFNQHLDYRLRDNLEREALIQKSTEIWENFSKVSFDYQKDKTKVGDFTSVLSYNLIAACGRQSAFYYNVALPHFKTDEFLQIGLERYKKFLFLKKTYPAQYVVPCYVIDIIWHTHQLHPRIYKSETEKLLGKIFPHDDSTNDRTEGAILDVSFQQTKDLWKELYGENFVIPGSLYRGIAHNASMQNSRTLDVVNIGRELGKLCLKEVKLLDKRYNVSSKQGLEVIFSIFKMNANEAPILLYNGMIASNRVVSLTHEWFFESDQIEFLLVMEQNMNINQRSYTRSPKIEISKIVNLKETSSEQPQEWTIKMYDQRDHKDYYLSLKFASHEKIKMIEMDLHKSAFKGDDFNKIKNNLSDYDIAHISYNIEKVSLKSAKHQVYLSGAGGLVCFYVNIWHIHNPRLSGLQILNAKNELLATSRTIGSEQLPSEQLNEKFICLKPGEECAMIVKNRIGDYSIVKGKWLKEEASMKVEYYYDFNRSPLEFKLKNWTAFFIHDKSEEVRVRADFNAAKLNITIGNKDFRNHDADVEALLASVFSIAVLNSLLQH